MRSPTESETEDEGKQCPVQHIPSHSRSSGVIRKAVISTGARESELPTGKWCGTIPVELRAERDNPIDPSAIAFVCKVQDCYERIGYMW